MWPLYSYNYRERTSFPVESTATWGRSTTHAWVTPTAESSPTSDAPNLSPRESMSCPNSISTPTGLTSWPGFTEELILTISSSAPYGRHDIWDKYSTQPPHPINISALPPSKSDIYMQPPTPFATAKGYLNYPHNNYYPIDNLHQQLFWLVLCPPLVPQHQHQEGGELQWWCVLHNQAWWEWVQTKTELQSHYACYTTRLDGSECSIVTGFILLLQYWWLPCKSGLHMLSYSLIVQQWWGSPQHVLQEHQMLQR